MKEILRSAVAFMLKVLAHLKLITSPGVVIGITGSVGKTTTKEAIAHVLSQKYKIRYSKGGLNTEFGVPMLILDLKQHGNTPVDWLLLICKGVINALTPQHIEYYIVEMGIDAPGDMEKLVDIVSPHIGILTEVAKNHAEKGQLETVEDVLREKAKIFSKQTEKDIAIINTDNSYIADTSLVSRTISYGKNMHASAHISNIKQDKELSFSVTFNKVIYDLSVPALGKHLVTCFAPAIVVGALAELTKEEIESALHTFSSPRGRMSIIEGINESIIVDSSYNASPIATHAAIDTIDEMKAPRKILCLGQMNELGETSEEEHIKLGIHAAKVADLLITVATKGKIISQSAIKAGLKSEYVHHFPTSKEAGVFLKPVLQKHDLVLVKGSQGGVFMEELIKEVMKNPKQANTLLVRQNSFWRKKKGL